MFGQGFDQGFGGGAGSGESLHDGQDGMGPDGRPKNCRFKGRVFPATEAANTGLFNYILPQAEVLPDGVRQQLNREIY